jgi:dynein heavy chain
MYVTSARGATFVYTANLNMEDEFPTKWILSGTCLLMSDDWSIKIGHFSTK